MKERSSDDLGESVEKIVGESHRTFFKKAKIAHCGVALRIHIRSAPCALRVLVLHRFYLFFRQVLHLIILFFSKEMTFSFSPSFFQLFHVFEKS